MRAGGRGAGVRATHARDWLSGLRECVPPRVRVPAARPCSVAFQTPWAVDVSRAALSNARKPKPRVRTFKYTIEVFFSIGTNSSVHMVHLVDIFRSAKVEYPPSVIVSKEKAFQVAKQKQYFENSVTIICFAFLCFHFILSTFIFLCR